MAFFALSATLQLKATRINTGGAQALLTKGRRYVDPAHHRPRLRCLGVNNSAVGTYSLVLVVGGKHVVLKGGDVGDDEAVALVVPAQVALQRSGWRIARLSVTQVEGHST